MSAICPATTPLFVAVKAAGRRLREANVVSLPPPIDPVLIAVRSDPVLARAFNGIGLSAGQGDEAWIEIERRPKTIVRLHVPGGSIERGRKIAPVVRGVLERVGLRIAFSDLFRTGNGSRYDGYVFIARVIG